MALRMNGYLMASVAELRIASTAQRVRCFVDGSTVADTTSAMLIWEPRRLVPMYAVPEKDLDAELVPTHSVGVDLATLPPALGPENFALHTCPGQAFTVRTQDRDLPGAAFRPSDRDLAGRVELDWNAFEWMEENQPVIGHPHDPFKRIDVLPSDRHVVVSLDGGQLAESRRPVALLETHLPLRWYLPREDVRMDLLEASEHRTICAYKGHAAYFSVPGSEQGRDVAWTYADPLHDALLVKNHICFFSERIDLVVDGVMLERPVTLWSKPD